MSDHLDILEAAKARPLTGGPSFSRANRLHRALWSLTWRLLGIWTPAPLHGWRRFLLRAFGAQLAPTSRIYPGVTIWYPPHLRMAEHSTLGHGVICYCIAPVSLGPFALVSQRAHLCTGTHDVDDPHFQLVARPITIGARAWVAAEAFVGPGVTVGVGAVLGARGVAMRDLAPWTIHAGNPAKALRKRHRADA